MAASKITEVLRRAYLGTSFEVDTPEDVFAIRVGEASGKLDALLQRHREKCWAYVTACNPRSTQLTSAANAHRQSELRAYLISMGFTIYPGRGVPAEPDWQPEDSFLVLGIAPQQAARLGVMLEQNAIVLGKAGEPASLMLCELPGSSEGERMFRDDADTLSIQRYIDEHITELWSNADVSGIWIRESDLPVRVDPDDLGILESKIPSQRLAALKAGKKPNAEELRLWRDAWIARALEDGGDADRVPGYAISKVSLPGKDVAYVLILSTGYSFTEVERWVEGIFSSREAATAHIAANGWHT